MKTILRFLCVILFFVGASCKKDINDKNVSAGYTVSTLPGTFAAPLRVSVDAGGNIYVTDATENRIMKISANGSVNYSFSGNGDWGMADGTSTSATFWRPEGLANDAAGNIYVADVGNNSVRKILPDGSVSTLAGGGNGGEGYVDGSCAIARFNHPQGVAVDAAGNIYVADSENQKIRKITTTGQVSTLAPEHPFAGSPYAIACDGAGIVYVGGYNQILKISLAGQVSTIGQQGVDYYPTGVAADNQGNVFYVNRLYNCIGKISASGGTTIIAGSNNTWEPGYADGDGDVARFSGPMGIALDAHGNIYVTDWGNKKIRKIEMK